MTILYFATYAALTNEFLSLGRILKDESGIRGERYLCGEWIEDPSATDFDPTQGDWIEEHEVEKFKRMVDAKYPPDKPPCKQ